MTNEPRHDDDLRLWRRYTASADAGDAGRIDENLLAAYLDGKASPEEVEAVEAAMAADPALLETVAALREPVDAAGAEPSAHVLARAQALVPQGAAAQSRRQAVLKLIFGRSAWIGAAAAACLVASFGGFHAGKVMYRPPVQQVRKAPPPPVGLEDLMSEPLLGAAPELDDTPGGGS